MPGDLPPPLPPETRTVGQLVAETIQLYRRNVPAALAIGVAPALLDVLGTRIDRTLWFAISPVVGAILLTPAYVAAAVVATGERPGRERLRTAYAAGALAFLPFPPLAALFLLPGLAWLALVGLVVPVAIVEGTGVRASFRRAVRLARADYVHALGSLATLALVVFLTRAVLFLLLRDLGDATALGASIAADVVISPLVLLGAALLYFDQAARAVDSRARTRRPRRSDADLHHADDADGAGSPDPAVEPGAPARGQP